MLCDSNGFKPYIYIIFQNLSKCRTYIYSIGPTPNPLNIIFWVVSEISGTAEAVLTGHVRVSGFQPI
jgi:hypothetical protein